MTGKIDYDRWYLEVPAVMDTHQLAELLNTNEQIVRAQVREGIFPAYRKPGGRKFTFLRHEIFDGLISGRHDRSESRRLSVINETIVPFMTGIEVLFRRGLRTTYRGCHSRCAGPCSCRVG